MLLIQYHYPAIGSAKDYLLIWRPDETCNSTLLNKLVAYCLLVTPEENTTMLVHHFYFNGYFKVKLGELLPFQSFIHEVAWYFMGQTLFLSPNQQHRSTE